MSNTDTAAKGTDELTFEDALAKLEILVENMEEGDIPLAELVDSYTRGNDLLKHCQRKLKDAELKIEKLSAADPADPADPVFEPLDAEES